MSFQHESSFHSAVVGNEEKRRRLPKRVVSFAWWNLWFKSRLRVICISKTNDPLKSARACWQISLYDMALSRHLPYDGYASCILIRLFTRWNVRFYNGQKWRCSWTRYLIAFWVDASVDWFISRPFSTFYLQNYLFLFRFFFQLNYHISTNFGIFECWQELV